MTNKRYVRAVRAWRPVDAHALDDVLEARSTFERDACDDDVALEIRLGRD
jgi:hypothetical protein